MSLRLIIGGIMVIVGFVMLGVIVWAAIQTERDFRCLNKARKDYDIGILKTIDEKLNHFNP